MSDTDDDQGIIDLTDEGERPPKMRRSNAMGSVDLRTLGNKRGTSRKYGQDDHAKHRNYCFTLFPNAETWYDEMKDEPLHSDVVFLIYQLEACPTTGRPHIQGYVEFKKQLTKKDCIATIHMRGANVRAANGTQEQNIKYCSKEPRLRDTVERGARKRQGKRTDLDAVADIIRSGGSVSDVADQLPVQYIKFNRGITSLANIRNKPKMRPKPVVYFLWGDPGCGKSRVAFHLAQQLGEGKDPYMAGDHPNCWMDNYQNEPVIIFDDFSGKFDQQKMFNLLDFYPLQLPVKGGFTPINTSTFIFTSNYRPNDLYCGWHNGAWMRRLTHIWEEPRVKAEYASRFEEPEE